MSKTIDEKVVSLEFDNSKFESNVKQSLSTLDKLKAKLNFSGASKGLEDIDKASKKIDFSNAADSVETLRARFSALDVVGVTALQNLTNRVVDFGVNLAKSMSGFDLLRSGWSKMDQMTGSVQTLVNSTGLSVEEITRYLNKLMTFSDETSFGFNDMTSALATMTSSGGDIKKLIPMIEGIANATAYAGKGAAEFSRVIYNLNQSYSGGYLQLTDWKSIQLAGVNSKALMEILIQTGEELGKINKGTVTLANFTETLKDKWADREVMELTFYRFAALTEAAQELYETGQVKSFTEAYELLSGQFEETAERAAKSAQEAKTFKEAIDSVTDAASSKWLQVFSKIFGNYNEAKKLWTNVAYDLYDIFVTPIDNMAKDIISPAFNSKWENFTDLLSKSGVQIDDLDDKFIKFIKDYGDWSGDLTDEAWSEEVDRLIKDYGSLSNLLSSGEIDSKNYVKRFFDSLTEGAVAVDNVSSKLEKAQKLFDDIWSGGYGNGEDRIKNLTADGYDYAAVQKMINDLASKGHRSGYKLLEEDISNLSDEMLISIGLSEEEASALKDLAEQAKETGTPINELLESMNKKSGRQLLAESIQNIIGTILNLKNIVGEAWKNVFAPEGTAGTIYYILEKFNDFTTRIVNATSESKLFKSALESIFSVFRLITNVIGQFTKGGISILSKIFDSLNIKVGDFSESISKTLDSFVDWVAENNVIFNTLDTVGNKIGDLLKIAKDWFDTFMQLPVVTSFIQGFNDTINNLQSNIKDLGNGKLTLGSIKDSFTGLITDIKTGNVNPIEAFTRSVGAFFGNLGNQAVEAKDKVSNSVKGLIAPLKLSEETANGILNELERMISTLIGIAGGYMVLKGFTNLTDAFSKLMTPIQTFNNLIKSFTGVNNAISGYINELKRAMWINNIIKLAIAIGLLAAALYVMGKVDGPGLWGAIGALLAISAIMVGLAYAFSQIPVIERGAANLGRVLLSIAGAILIIAVALKMLDSVENIERNAIVAIVLIGGLVAACIGLAKWAKGIEVGNRLLLTLSVTLFILAALMKKLSKMDGPALARAAQGMIVAIGSLALLVALMSKIPNSKTAGLQILALSLSLNYIIKALEKFSKMDPKTYVKGLLAMIPIFGLFTAIMTAVKISGSNAASAGVYVLAMSVSLNLLYKAIEKFGKMSIGVLTKGGIAITILMGVITTIGVLAGSFSKYFGSMKQMLGMSLMIIALSASLYLIAGVVLIFKNIKAADLYKAVGAIAILELAFGAMVALMNSTKGFNADSFKAIGALATVIAILAGSVFVLSMIDTDKLIASVGSMLSLILSLSVLITSMRFINKDNVGAILGGALSMVVLLGAVGGILYALSKYGNVEKYITISESIMKVLVSLSAMCLSLAAAGAIAATPGTTLGAVKLLGLIGIIGGILIGIGELIVNFGDISRLEQVTQALEQVGTAIGSFFGGLIGGALGSTAQTVTDFLPAVGKNLSDFATNLGSFLSISLPEGFTQTAKDLVSVIATMANPTMIGQLKSLAEAESFGSDLATFFDGFGTAIIDFSNKLVAGNFNSEAVEAAANAGHMMASLYDSLPRSGSEFMKWFSGEKSLKQFSSDLVDYAEGLNEVSSVIKSKEFDEEAVKTAHGLGQMMLELLNGLPKTGSSFTWLTGEKSLSEFASQMKAYAIQAVSTANILKNADVTAEDVQIAKDIGDIMLKLIENIPESTSISSMLFGGEKSLADFGANMVLYVESVKTICESLKDADLDTTNIDNAITIGGKFSELIESIPESGGFFEKNKDLGAFGQQLTTFATHISEFVTSLAGVSPETISAALQLIITMLNLEELKEKLFSAIEVGFTDLTKLLETYITELCSKIHEDVSNFMDELIELLDRSGDAAEAGRSTLEGLYTGLTDGALLGQIEAACEEIGSKVIKAYNAMLSIRSPSREMAKAGRYTILGLIEGLKDNEAISTVGQEVGSMVLTSIQSAIEAANSILGDDLNPVITPVLDLSNIQGDAGLISSLLNANGSYNNALGIHGLGTNGLNQNGVLQPEINIEINVNNNGRDLTEEDLSAWSDQIVNKVNVELGKLII